MKVECLIVKVVIIVILILCTLNSIVSDSLADDKPRQIMFYYLTNPDIEENSSLSGKCTGNTSSYEIECTFWQTRVRLALNPADLNDEVEKVKPRLINEFNEFGGLKKWAKSLCNDVNVDSQEFIKKMDEKKDQMTSRDIRGVNFFIDFCEHPTSSKFEKFLIDSIVDETVTCKVSVDFEGTKANFKKVAKNKWVSNEGPRGLCDETVLIVLEHAGDGILWTYIQTRTYANQDNESCRALEVNKPLVYDWKEKTIELNCKFIEYGF